MLKSKDLTGQQFGWLIVQQQVQTPDRHGNLRWQCLCQCGKICTAIGYQLQAGIKRSCGCLQRTNTQKMRRKGKQLSLQTRVIKRRLKELGL